MLVLSRKKNEAIILDDNIEVRILDIKGDVVKIGIKAPKNVKVFRQEVYEAIIRENREAQSSVNQSALNTLNALQNEENKQKSKSGK